MTVFTQDTFHLCDNVRRPSQRNRQLNELFGPLDGSAYPCVRYSAAAGTQHGLLPIADAWAWKFDSRRLSRFQGPPYANCEGILEIFWYLPIETITF